MGSMSIQTRCNSGQSSQAAIRFDGPRQISRHFFSFGHLIATDIFQVRVEKQNSGKAWTNRIAADTSRTTSTFSALPG